jgi:hypothetical protein
LLYGNKTWTLSQEATDKVNKFEIKIYLRIFGSINVNGVWRIRVYNELK